MTTITVTVAVAATTTFTVAAAATTTATIAVMLLLFTLIVYRYFLRQLKIFLTTTKNALKQYTENKSYHSHQ